MDSPLKKNQPDSPRVYHLELYDSLEDFFPEEPFRRRDLSVCENRATQDVEQQRARHVERQDQQLTDDGREENDKGDNNVLEDKDESRQELYCITCCVPVTAFNGKCNKHQEHEVMSLAAVVEIAKVRTL